MAYPSLHINTGRVIKDLSREGLCIMNKIQHLTQLFQRMRCIRHRLDLKTGDLTGDAKANGGFSTLLFSLKCIMGARQGRLSIQANGVGGCSRRSDSSIYVLEADKKLTSLYSQLLYHCHSKSVHLSMILLFFSDRNQVIIYVTPSEYRSPCLIK